MSSQIMTTAEVAEHLGKSTRTIKRWRRRQTGPPYYLVAGRLVRYLRAEVDEFKSVLMPGR